MKLSLEQDHLGNLVVRQHAGSVLRYTLGLPLMLLGTLTLYGALSNLVAPLREGLDTLPSAIMSAIVLLVFCAFTLPLGWWLTLGRHWKMIEEGSHDIIEISDWRVWRHEKRIPVKVFCAVRVAMEPLNSPSTASHRQHVTYCQQIRLLAKSPEKQPSLEIGSLEEVEREQAIEKGRLVAEMLNLPLDVAPADVVLYSPAREAEDEMQLDDAA